MAKRGPYRLVLTPVYPTNGARAEGPVYVYTWPHHLAGARWRRWRRENYRSPILRTPEGWDRYHLHIMDADYWHGHRPTGDVRHLGDRTARFLPDEAAAAMAEHRERLEC